MSESKSASVVFTNSSLLAKNAQATADRLNIYVRGSRGSSMLESILSMDPNNSTIAQVVNGQVVAAINTSSNGSVKIDGKNIQLDGNTTVTGRLDLIQQGRDFVKQDWHYHNPWYWDHAHIYFDNYLRLQGENCWVTYTNTKTTLNSHSFYSLATLTPGYLKFTTYQHRVNDDDKDYSGQICRTYVDAGRIETPEVYTDGFVIAGNNIRVRNNKYLMLTNKAGTNFNNDGSVGLQVYGGIGLGKETIYNRSSDLYIQQGNVVQTFDQKYHRAGKVDVHCNRVISGRANTVSSRLSVKTDIAKVTYDRALAAVEGTDMYDYRYVDDDSNQHYVSGIIDDVNPDPQYHMDGMLIDKDHAARIDANLVGYHHVVIQNLLERVAALEAKLK
ncbi:hypothetical protein ACIA4Q_02495 [Lactobacillus delbrueckii subsp. bulgaricus]